MPEVVERTCYRHPDRITGLSCSECGRPICTECMTMAPVGIRCPEHSGRPQGAQRVSQGVRRASFEGLGAKVTRTLIGINVAVYIAELATGGGFVLERQRDYVFGGSALGIIVINFIFTFSISSISKGGHIGGLIGGILCALGLTRFGRGHAAYGRAGAIGIATIAIVGIASVAIAYWKVRGYA